MNMDDGSIQNLFTAFAIVWVSYLFYAIYLHRMQTKIRAQLKSVKAEKK